MSELKSTDYAPTSADERARRLIGDMPWVTEHLTPQQRTDLQKQIATCIAVAVSEENADLVAACDEFLQWDEDTGSLDVPDRVAVEFRAARARVKGRKFILSRYID